MKHLSRQSLLVFLCLCVAGCLSNEGYERQVAFELGVEYKRPKDWVFIPFHPIQFSCLHWEFPSARRADAAGVYISLSEKKTSEWTPQSAAESAKRSMKWAFPDAVFQPISFGMVGGLPSATLAFCHEVDDRPQNVRMTIVAHRAALYYLIAYMPEPAFASASPAVDDFVRSVSFDEMGPTPRARSDVPRLLEQNRQIVRSATRPFR